MPIEFTEPQEPMKFQAPTLEDSAIIQKRANVLLSETQQVMERLSEIDSRMMAQDFSICIGWGRIKVCLTVEETA